MPLPLKHQHPWSLTPAQAVALQKELRRYVILQDECSPIRTVAGVDCGFEEQGAITRAAVVVLDFPSLQRVDQGVARLPTCFPYIPGLLSFREVPAVLAALEQLTILPDLLLVDGQGFAHPRRFGIACHLGVLTDLPSIGVGKTRLLGRHDEPAQQRGAWAALMDGDEKIGVVLRTRTKVSPLYISAGHRISLETAVDWVLRCAPRFRLPETTRQAHRLASG